ncbi:uncharacterized protein HMPREF1541_10116 [Cyphellophora europaea CBS 101466]|uniref:Uncharacterized protein n=1 Tax=Cyphellophora europaea (strain CBS 101466) TaxID=1220924 RepID=W2SBE1_CYPE1|nr:uncharacterized protein HMPREF1541_10116 [Cyphellophora europaea CBS 101466]ETN45239.1 hypothetical protein HMPREF1541_10116 [Cyphellophora europaea CBS 101466]
MTGAAPLLRTVDTAARSSRSRIPHLKAHINSRHLRLPTASLSPRPCKSQPIARQPSYGTRSSTSTAVNGHFFGQLGDAQGEARHEKSAVWTAPVEFENITSDHGVGLDSSRGSADEPKSLSAWDLREDEHPDRVFFALIHAADGAQFIHTASDHAFSRAFCQLDPEHFIEAYKPLYQDLPPSLHIGPAFRTVRSLEDRCKRFVRRIQRIMQMRTDAGFPLTLDVYRHVLWCAEVACDEQFARLVFDREMSAQGVDPDEDCYNSLLAACAKSGLNDVAHRKHHRRTQYHLDRRENVHGIRDQGQLAVLGRGRPHRSEPAGLRDYVLRVFKQMGEQGFAGNEKTFTSLMLALGQDGDMNGVKSILRSVWNINTELLLTFDEEEIESPTFYEENSPLRPTGRLLDTVVHVFGNNNEMYVASLLNDYLSRNYNINAPQHVWEKLFELTYQFARRENAWHRSRNWSPGHLPGQALPRLFEMMTDEPHNVQPTVQLLTRLSQNAGQHFEYDAAIGHLREAVRLLDVEQTKLSELYDRILPSVTNVHNESYFLSDEFFADRQLFIQHSIQVDADLQAVILAVRRLLRRQRPPRSELEQQWEHVTQRIPDIIREFQTKLPNEIGYKTMNGAVRIKNGYLHRSYAIELADAHFIVKTGILRRALDLDHHSIMIERLRRVPRKLERFSKWCFLCCKEDHSLLQCPDRDRILAGPMEVLSYARPTLTEDGADEEPSTGWALFPEVEEKPQVVEPPVRESRSNVLWIRSSAEMWHQEHLKARWHAAEKGDGYAGQTPDPVKRPEAGEEKEVEQDLEDEFESEPDEAKTRP